MLSALRIAPEGGEINWHAMVYRRKAANAAGSGAAEAVDRGRGQVGPDLVALVIERVILKPGDADWPEAAYNGDYIADVAADFAAKKTVHADDREFTASGLSDDLDGIRQFAVAYLRHEQDLDLQAFGVRFDHYYLESSLYTSGRVEEAVAKLVAAGKLP